MQFELYKHPSDDEPDVEYWCWRLVKDDVVLAYSANRFSNLEECKSNIALLISIDHSIPIIQMSEKKPHLMTIFMNMLNNKNKSE